MKVLYVGTLPPHPGGTAVFGEYLLAGLVALGHSVRALAPITPEALIGGDAFAARHGRVLVRRYVVPAFQISSNQPLSEMHQAIERAAIQAQVPALVADERPDVIIMGRESFAWHVSDVAQDLALPSALLVHGTTLPPETGRHLLSQFRRADLILTVASHLATTLAAMGLEGVEAIPNPVDLTRFRPLPPDPRLRRDLGIGDRDVVVAHVSNLKVVKRPLDVLRSAERALGADPRLVYLIVGDGPCRAAMENWCRERAIGPRVRFVGWVDHDRMPAYLNLADVVAMPSESEGQALVYLETQACGRLILASDIPAAREVIVDGESGLLFPTGDIEALAESTLRAARDPAWRAAIGRRARAGVQAHDADHVVRRYAGILERHFVSGRRPRPTGDAAGGRGQAAACLEVAAAGETDRGAPARRP